MTNVTAGSSERDSYLPQADWFDTKKFPAGQFVSTAIRKTGDNTFAVDGNLNNQGSQNRYIAFYVDCMMAIIGAHKVN